MPAPDPLVLLAYGPAPGMELIPYFLALLAWVGLAVAAVVASPFRALYRLIRAAPPAPNPPAPPAPESTGEPNSPQT